MRPIARLRPGKKVTKMSVMNLDSGTKLVKVEQIPEGTRVTLRAMGIIDNIDRVFLDKEKFVRGPKKVTTKKPNPGEMRGKVPGVSWLLKTPVGNWEFFRADSGMTALRPSQEKVA